MSKYLQRIHSTEKQYFFIHIVVLGIYVPVLRDHEDISVEWKRGSHRELSKKNYSILAQDHVAEVSEEFFKLSIFYKDTKKDKYQKKYVRFFNS